MNTQWSIEDSNELYKIQSWGANYFGINQKGHIIVTPKEGRSIGVDLKTLVEDLKKRKIESPVLIRFMDILEDRIDHINSCFHQAIAENDYPGKYHLVYPVKVNQQKQVIEEIVNYGIKYHMGLEAGSKAELLAVLAMSMTDNSPIICNGYKDDDFIELAFRAFHMGKNIIPVIEKISEVATMIKYAKALNIIPQIGLRVKLFAKGNGHWGNTGGDSSKFGLYIAEVLDVIEMLRKENLLNSLCLLHFSIGSQITDIAIIKQALSEGVRIYAEMVKMGVPLKYLDVGGGLGVNYDGSLGQLENSLNYSNQEYANDVVFRIKTVCDEANIQPPHIITESGRALVAHYSVLISNVLGVHAKGEYEIPQNCPKDAPGPLKELFNLLKELKVENYRETYYDAIQYREEALSLFNLGYLSLEHRGVMEIVFWGMLRRLRNLLEQLEEPPPELPELEEKLTDIYFTNLSIFQSLPDSWAIKQLFPIIPIHRLNTKPNRKGIIVDITCDSDGRIDRYIGEEETASHIALHDLHKNENYYLGFFLVGAYQEILGDLHNLLGDTHAVHIKLQPNGKYLITKVIRGESIKEVLGWLDYDSKEVCHLMRSQIEKAVNEETISLEDSSRFITLFEHNLEKYTYLEKNRDK